MQTWESILANKSGTFPDCLAINSTGAATPDGTEFIAAFINNFGMGVSQSIMDYAGGSANAPTGSVGTPNGVTEAAGVSQIVEAIHKMTGSGPGTVKPWMKEDDPSVTGDRVLLLQEQGVLIASYPDLDDATWIGGNTAAQVAAEAAGQKFYRSSDAGGATGDAAGPYLQLPANMPIFNKQYLGDGTDFTITGPAGFALTRGVAVPYQTSNGVWRLKGNFDYTHNAVTNASVTLSGVTFKNGADQAGVNTAQLAAITTAAWCNSATSAIQVRYSAAQTATNLFFDFELNSKPTWADDFEVQWGITY